MEPRLTEMGDYKHKSFKWSTGNNLVKHLDVLKEIGNIGAGCTVSASAELMKIIIGQAICSGIYPDISP